MAKESGLGAGFFLDGVDLSGDVGAMKTITKSLKPINMTGLDKFAIERKAGQLDGEITWDSFFNPTNAHLKLEDLPRTDVIGSYIHKLADLGTPVASLVAKQTNYDGNRSEEGELNFAVQTLANAYWLDWGLSLNIGKRTDTGATNGSGVDFGARFAEFTFGLQAYLQVFAPFTGTSAVVKLQHSNDDAATDPYTDVTGGAFTAVTAAPGSQRIETGRTLTVKRWLRAVTTGTFSSFTFAVSACVNTTSSLF